MSERTSQRPKTSMARLALALLLSIALCAPLGCGKGEEEQPAEPAMPEPITDVEEQRGLEACEAYKARVCACAASKPDDAEMQEMCELAPGKLSSLKMVLRVNRSPKTADERYKTSRTAKRIMGSCISEQGKLDSKGCPRPAP